MYHFRITIAAMILLMTVAACKKNDKDNSDVTFVNNVNTKVTLDLYTGFTDYGGNTNVYMRKVLQPNETTVLPGSAFKSGQTYYMDWYTDDYYYNNWFNDDYSVGNTKIAIKPVVGNNTYYINPQFQGNNRSAFLNRTGSSSTWFAVGAYAEYQGGYVSHWVDLNANEQYREVTVNKDFTAVYKYKNGSGEVVAQPLAFMVHNTKDPYIEFVSSDSSSKGSMVGGRLPTSLKPNFASSATDSVMAYLPNSDLYFLMVRQ